MMPFLLPFLFIGLIIVVSVLSARSRRHRVEHSRQEEEMMAAAIAQKNRLREESEAAQKQTDAHPIQTATVRPTVSPAAAASAPIKRQGVPETAVRVYDLSPTESPQKESEQQYAAASPLRWTANSALEGMLYAEILGKPKALRKH